MKLLLRKIVVLSILTLVCTSTSGAQSTIDSNNESYVSFTPIKKGFPLFHDQQLVPIVVSELDFPGVIKITGHLQKDLLAVTSQTPNIKNKIPENSKFVIIIGTLGKSPLIEELINSKKLDGKALKGKWEKHIITTISNPFKGIDKALVIAGSDKRGTIYGIYDLSKKMGVSPWYYWAEVPVAKQENLYIKPGSFTNGEPSVKYRGIFINDEAPALRGWAEEKFGGFNHLFYDKVFELILRSNGNYLWPAMWRPTAFADDDPENPKLADEYGVVISTSHHEPMMRTHDEWSRYGKGSWNYKTNKENLQEFWRQGIVRMNTYESVVTLGMRGDGDEAMGEDTAVDLLKEIIRDQRKILTEVTQKPIEQTPQVWAIYKEVQDYYDKGMRVDDDIMILFCDDNWGNVRILPKKEDFNYKGGFGMYYHFDFVGGPVSYRWLNVTQIEKVWEQMKLSYDWGVRDLWLVNVGDIKPMELPTSFFLDFAWNAKTMKASSLPDYYIYWASQQFGPDHAKDIAEIVALYTKYNARRTPEMLKPGTYSLENYREADRVVKDYKDLVERSTHIYNALEESYKPAFYQLVLSPVELCSNLNEMYVAVAKNKLYAQQGRASANDYADKAKECFLKDANLTDQYHQLENGKWNHMMSQTHIGYTSWNNPPVNKMPDITYIQPKTFAELGYYLENGLPRDNGFNFGSDGLYSPSFSPFDPINDQNYYVEIFNKGREKLTYSITANQDWIKLSSNGGTIQYDERVVVSINWDKAPKDEQNGELTILAGDRQYTVLVPVKNYNTDVSGFIENTGVVSINASNYTNKHETKNVHWVVVPNMGRTASAITIEPANAEPQTITENAPSLEYDFFIFNDSDLKVEAYVSPTLNFKKENGLKYAVAIDGETPQILNINEGETTPDWEYPDWWNTSVTDHIKKKRSVHNNIKSGKHTLKIWMIDPGIVFQKFVIDAGGLKPSYLGPPESNYYKSGNKPKNH